MCEIVKDVIHNLLTEDKEYRGLKKARNAAKLYAGAKTYQDAMDVINSVRNDIPYSRAFDCKFIAGIIRLIYKDGVESNQFGTLNDIIEAIVKSPKSSEHYNSDLNSLTYKALLSQLKPIMDDIVEKERKSIDGMTFQDNGYTIVHIPNYLEAQPYSRWNKWCINYYEPTFLNYVGHGETLYYCLKNGYQQIKKEKGYNHPKDEYGLSMIAVAVTPSGRMVFSTTRWNDTGIGNKSFTPKELSQVVGKNFYDTFVPIQVLEPLL